jgi:hypothetical protein
VELTRRYANFPELLRTPVTPVAPRPDGRPERPRQRLHKVVQRLDEATISRLVQDYEDGIPTTRLTREYSLGKGTVLKLLETNGATIRRQPRLDDGQIAEARRLYDHGWSTLKIGRHLGRNPDTVRRALQRVGVVIRGPHERLV